MSNQCDSITQKGNYSGCFGHNQAALEERAVDLLRANIKVVDSFSVGDLKEASGHIFHSCPKMNFTNNPEPMNVASYGKLGIAGVTEPRTL